MREMQGCQPENTVVFSFNGAIQFSLPFLILISLPFFSSFSLPEEKHNMQESYFTNQN